MENKIFNLGNRLVDEQGNVVYFSEALMELLYNGLTPCNLMFYPMDDVDVQAFNKYSYENFDDVEFKMPNKIPSHEDRKNIWFYPHEYETIDLESYFLNLCSLESEKERVKEELKLYKEKGFEKFLRNCIYLADKIKKNDWVVGVGRGSSCCSYLLYLIKIHLVNSLEYELDIKEFLK